VAHLTKKQRQERFLEEFLRQIPPPGDRVYIAVGDLFEAAEARDLEEERAVRRAAEDRGGDDER
jgi:UDP-2,3-diacylglucosamine pyrophosphatase LpxH